MADKKSSYKTHVFICTNAPDREGKCGNKGSEELRRGLKDICKEKYGKQVRINSSGCLGFCEKGIAAVIYPEGKWHFDLDKRDEKLLLNDVEKSQKK